MILDVVCRYLSLFLLYIKIGKNGCFTWGGGGGGGVEIQLVYGQLSSAGVEIQLVYGQLPSQTKT